MTVSSETNHAGPYNGNGSTVTFSFDFRVVSSSHLDVILTSVAGAETTLALSSDYTVAGVGDDAGGSVTLAVAPATGESVTILRSVPFTQETDLENQGAYYAETIERSFDLAAMRDQQLQEQIDRSVKVPASYTGVDLDVLTSAILRASDSADNIDIIAGSIGSVNAVAPAVDEIAIVAENIAAIISADGSVMSLLDSQVTAVAAQTVFTMPAAPISANNVLVWVGGVRQVPNVNYTVSGTTLTLASAPGAGISVEMLVVSAVSVEAVGVLRDQAAASAAAAAASAAMIGSAMQGSNNLSEVVNKATALATLGGAAKSANLSDIPDKAAARSNLGLSSGATTVVSTFGASLIDDTTAAAARTTLGLGSGALVNFTPVQQGGGAGQLTNKVYLGWDGARLRLQVDSTDFGQIAYRTELPDVATATASLGVGEVGTYALLAHNYGSNRGPGDYVSGSSLKYINVAATASSSALAGTWKCMGNAPSGAYTTVSASVWLRIA